MYPYICHTYKGSVTLQTAAVLELPPFFVNQLLFMVFTFNVNMYEYKFAMLIMNKFTYLLLITR